MSIDAGPTILPEAIYDELRALIIDQTYAPGVTITESAVALRFSVARPTAKMAIERLVTEGLLRREKHRAARVPQLERDDIIDLFDNRAIVERAAVTRLAESGILPTEAIAANRALLVTADGSFARHDIAFHRALVAGQPSARLARMHELLMGEIELCIGQVQAAHLLTATEVGLQHQGILDAVLAGDAVLAAKLSDDHIAGSRDRLTL
jgi:DNA-binding GntR family transcriptional regulator